MAKNTKVVVGPNFLAHWYIYDFQVCEGRRSCCGRWIISTGTAMT